MTPELIVIGSEKAQHTGLDAQAWARLEYGKIALSSTGYSYTAQLTSSGDAPSYGKVKLDFAYSV